MGEDGMRSEEEDVAVQQIRVSFRLSPECNDENLAVPTEAIAIPSHLHRKGLSAVINHLLGREVESDNEEDSDNDDKERSEDNDEVALDFDFLVGKESRRLLRTSLDKE